MNHVYTYTASSLEEYLKIVALISEMNRDFEDKKYYNALVPMWYRGNKKQHYNLVPTLLRESKGVREGYSVDHLREDYRYQHFKAKCNQLVEKSPETRIEWMELMQHFRAYTRMMDWSESAITALMFSLEAFIDPDSDSAPMSKRSESTPTVWVLNPVKLNYHIYESLIENLELVRKGFYEVIPSGISQTDRDKFIDKMSRAITNDIEQLFWDRDDPNIQGIICLSAIESDRQANATRIFHMLEDGEYNPFFYLLLRYYSDGLSVDMNALPPLAIVHPYHSHRIQVQHGVFTVSPYYKIDGNKVNGPEDSRPMEFQPKIRDCLYKIRILRPASVAKELLTIGMRRTALYPEMDNYAKDIEANGYMV